MCERNARAALQAFGVEPEKLTLLRQSENTVYRVLTADGSAYVLRLHTAAEGFAMDAVLGVKRDMALLQGEMALLERLTNAALFPTQRPVRTKDEALVALLPDGTPATLLTWLGGETLEAYFTTTDGATHRRQAGQTIARLHGLSSTGTLDGLTRCRYNRALLPRIRSALLQGEHAGMLQSEHCAVLYKALDAIDAAMESLGESPAVYGLLHGDPGAGNLLACGDAVGLIDFGLSGYGYYAMDVAGLLANVSDPAMRAQLLQGYASVNGSAPDARTLEPFFALQILLFLACQHTRFYQEDWFVKRMPGWIAETFRPLSEGRAFLQIQAK